jgi:hypothetical protein
MSYINSFIGFSFLVIFYYYSGVFSKKIAIKKITNWCANNNIELIHLSSDTFRNGSRAKMFGVVLKNGEKYHCKFEIHSFPLNIFNSSPELFGNIKIIIEDKMIDDNE